MAPLEEATGRIVKILREIKADVVITHDPGGSYGHPDHIATNRAATAAFYAAGDPEKYPDAGPAWQPKKLYYHVRPHTLMRFMVMLMPLFGQDPHHFGRNGDVDLTKTMSISYPAHALIRLREDAMALRNRAMVCHRSQLGGSRNRRRPLPFRAIETIDKIRGPREYYMRVYPEPNGRRKEKDLFEGIR